MTCDRCHGTSIIKGQTFRPGPVAEPRILGRRPSAGTYGVWSDALWQACVNARLEPSPKDLPRIGCDVARHGVDNTEMHVRWGACSLHHESHNGWDTVKTTARLIELARIYSAQCTMSLPAQHAPVVPKSLPLVVDDDGVGGGVSDQLKAAGYHAVLIGAGTRALRDDLYPNKRSELWFAAAEKARKGLIDLHRLDKKTLHELRRQLLAPEYTIDPMGRRVVEKKDDTKERLGRSPDTADAFLLAHYEYGQMTPSILEENDERREYRFRFGR